MEPNDRQRARQAHPGEAPERAERPVEEQSDDVWAGEDDPAELETELARRWIADLDEDEDDAPRAVFAAIIVASLVGAAVWLLLFYLVYRLIA